MKRLSLVLAVMMMAVPVAAWAFQADVVAPSGGERPVAFGVQLSGGMLNGKAKEHVFDNDVYPGERYQVSRLDWDIKNVAMAGFNASVRPIVRGKTIALPGGMTLNTLNGLTFNLGFWGALTEGNGEMEDYDWLDTDSSRPTHYSLSDVDVTEGTLVDLNVAWDFVTWKDLTGRMFLGYKQNNWKWEDEVVYLLYPEDHGARDYSLSGQNGINYEQEFQMPYLGAGFDFTPGNFTISYRLTYSPYLTASDKDHHVFRDLYFEEEFEGGDMIGFGLDARYTFSQKPIRGLYLSAAADYQKIGLIVGDMEFYDASTGETGGGEDVAGVENEYFIVSLGVGYQF